MLRTMNKNRFRRAIGVALWKEEHGRRLNTCKASRRLQIIAGELTEMAEEDNRKRLKRQSCPGAPYLKFVDSKFHARLLACTPARKAPNRN